MTAFVLLPGMDGSGSLFGEFASTVGAHCIVVSYPPQRPLDYAQLESIVEEALPKNQPFILLGESFSGPLAIAVGAKNPTGLKGIVLVCTFAKLRSSRAPKLLYALFALFPFWRLPVSLGARALLGASNSKTMQAKLGAAIHSVTPAVWRARLRSVLNVDVTSQLREIDVPILYLRASDDRIVPASASTLIENTNPQVTTVEIQGPHALLQTQPAVCAAAIHAFAREAGVALTQNAR